MPVAASVRYAAAVQALAAECRRRGLVVPGFRSPPRPPGVPRTIRRRPDGQAVVAVRLRGRPFAAVAADMVEGVLVVNGISGPPATVLRTGLLTAILESKEVWAA